MFHANPNIAEDVGEEEEVASGEEDQESTSPSTVTETLSSPELEGEEASDCEATSQEAAHAGASIDIAEEPNTDIIRPATIAGSEPPAEEEHFSRYQTVVRECLAPVPPPDIPQGQASFPEETNADNRIEPSFGAYEQFTVEQVRAAAAGAPPPTIISITHQPKVLSDPPVRRVSFSSVRIRSYKTTIGDNPCCGDGPPLSLDWDYEEDTCPPGIPVDRFEAAKSYQAAWTYRRKVANILLGATQRYARLFQAGYSTLQMKEAVKRLRRDQFRMRSPHPLDPLYYAQECWLFRVKPNLMRWSHYEDAQDARIEQSLQRELRRIERKVREEHQSQSSLVPTRRSRASSFLSSLRNMNSDSLLESIVETDVEQGMDASGSHRGQTRVVIEGMDGLPSPNPLQPQPNTFHHPDQDHSSCLTDNDYGVDHHDHNHDFGLKVDCKQHDRAMEIKLYSLRRPHMRAFHASWFSFFVAFFGWFSITPLLGEVKESLDLQNEDIWISSLMGACGTILMRILMGPLCDRFGARLCMAFILIAAAIPIALTGLIQTSAGLSLIRLFIGIGGSSFVACQYWTSDMFTREVAGTANALVAGWGNLGGGFAQLFMGSVFFPLFRLIYSGAGFEDQDDSAHMEEDTSFTSSELAWRTVFLVPALMSIATGLAIMLYCDDSPTGSYRDRIKNETLSVVNPLESLCAATKNWNVWILTLQYACCFGVEVTMTNATALYFKDEFGQSTVSAAGIASIFGFMNIFARGLGGFCSDYLQLYYGVRGRLLFQMTTLILEGVIVGVFAYAQSLAASIVTLVFLSIMVQAAEGSTFGIVPYVDRRFTGSVVGIVGSGGSLGAAIFSIFFVYFHYQPAFVVMGAVAVSSAFLSFLLNTQKIAQMHEPLNRVSHDHNSAPNEDGDAPVFASQRTEAMNTESLDNDFFHPLNRVVSHDHHDHLPKENEDAPMFASQAEGTADDHSPNEDEDGPMFASPTEEMNTASLDADQGEPLNREVSHDHHNHLPKENEDAQMFASQTEGTANGRSCLEVTPR